MIAQIQPATSAIRGAKLRSVILPHIIGGPGRTPKVLFVRRCFAIALTLLAVAATLRARGATPALDTAAVDAAVVKEMKAAGTPGVSIAIVRDGRIVYAKGYGFASIETRSPVTTETTFGIGSISKQFLAAEVLALQAQGRIHLTDTLAEYYPTFPHANAITIADLLSHEAGIRDYYPLDYNDIEMNGPTTMAAIVARAAAEPLDFAPRTQWQYSNTGYSTVGAIVERITGKTLYELYREQFFVPLGMASVRWNDSVARLPGEAVGYASFFLGPDEVAVPEGPGWRNAAGSLVMTASDLARWTIALMDDRALSRADTKVMWTSRRLKDGSDPGYGLGLGVNTYAHQLLVGHNGGIEGFTSQEVMVPNLHSAIVVLTNDEYGSGSTIAHSILPMLAGPPSPHSSASSSRASASTSPSPTTAPFERTLSSASSVTLAWLRAAAAGNVDRTLLTADFNAFMTPARIVYTAKALSSLGDPISASVLGSYERGGLTVDALQVKYPHRTVNAELYRQSDGKIAELFVDPG